MTSPRRSDISPRRAAPWCSAVAPVGAARPRARHRRVHHLARVRQEARAHPRRAARGARLPLAPARPVEALGVRARAGPRRAGARAGPRRARLRARSGRSRSGLAAQRPLLGPLAARVLHGARPGLGARRAHRWCGRTCAAPASSRSTGCRSRQEPPEPQRPPAKGTGSARWHGARSEAAAQVARTCCWATPAPTATRCVAPVELHGSDASGARTDRRAGGDPAGRPPRRPAGPLLPPEADRPRRPASTPAGWRPATTARLYAPHSETGFVAPSEQDAAAVPHRAAGEAGRPPGAPPGQAARLNRGRSATPGQPRALAPRDGGAAPAARRPRPSAARPAAISPGRARRRRYSPSTSGQSMLLHQLAGGLRRGGQLGRGDRLREGHLHPARLRERAEEELLGAGDRGRGSAARPLSSASRPAPRLGWPSSSGSRMRVPSGNSASSPPCSRIVRAVSSASSSELPRRTGNAPRRTSSRP